MPRSCSTRLAGTELLAHLGHHLLGQIQQHELHSLGGEFRLLAAASASARNCTVSSVPEYDAPTTTMVRRAAPAAVVVVQVGQFQLLQHVVAQIQRFGGRLQAPCVLREPGMSKSRVTEPGVSTRRSQDNCVATVLRVGESDGVPVEVDAVDPAADCAYPVQGAGQRDRDEPRRRPDRPPHRAAAGCTACSRPVK